MIRLPNLPNKYIYGNAIKQCGTHIHIYLYAFERTTHIADAYALTKSPRFFAILSSARHSNFHQHLIASIVPLVAFLASCGCFPTSIYLSYSKSEERVKCYTFFRQVDLADAVTACRQRSRRSLRGAVAGSGT